MKRHGKGLGIGGLLALGIFLRSGNAAPSVAEEDKKIIAAAQKDLLALASDLENGKLDASKTRAIRMKYEDVGHLMMSFNRRDKGGIGFGPKGPRDSIEVKLVALEKRALSKTQFGKEQAELLKMGYVVLAGAEISPHYASDFTSPERAREWKRSAAEWKKASREFIDAVKKGEPIKVKAAAINLQNACHNCHTDYGEGAE